MKRIAARVWTGCVLMVLFGLMPAKAEAQDRCVITVTSNRDFVRSVFCYPAVGGETSAQAQAGSQATETGVTRFVALALATAPVSSSSAGFSYGIDPATQRSTLKSDSFGPTFADRPLTNGRGVISVGFNYQFGRTEFSDNGDLTADGRGDGLPIFDNIVTYRTPVGVQYISRRGFLETSVQAFTFLVSYGVTDRLDVGVLVPLVSVSLKGHADQMWSLNVQPAFTPDSCLTARVSTTPGCATDFGSRSASGIGDIGFRAKYALTGGLDEGVAVATDVRLPTGNDDELLGSGKSSVKIQVLASKSNLGPASVHANAGYAFGGLSDEFSYIVGADAALLSGKQLTASFSLIGRNLRQAALPTILPSYPPKDQIVNIIEVNRFAWEETSLNLTQLAAGVKLNVGGRWLLGGSVLIPINRKGYQPGISPMISLEHTWVPGTRK